MEGFIYKIEFEDELYVGSTTSRLKQRETEHKYQLKKHNNAKLYTMLNEHNVSTVKCILLERIECQNREQLYVLEQKYIDELKPTLNQNRVRTNSKEYAKKYNPIYYENNKKRLATKYTCTCGKTLSYSGKSAHEKTMKHKRFILNNS